MPVRFDRLQQGLFEALAGLADVVTWVYGEQPKGAESLLSLDLAVPEQPGLRPHAFTSATLLPADSITISVDSLTVGQRQIVRLNGFDYRHDVSGADTLTTVRDDLLGQIQTGEAGAVTATANGADRLDLAADFLGGLRRLELLGADLGAEGAVFSGEAVDERLGSVVNTVSIQAFSKGRSPRDGAASIISAAKDRLRDKDVIGELCRYGLALRTRAPAVNLSAVAGAHWETRYAFDLDVVTATVAVTPAAQIDTVIMGIVIPGVGTVDVTAAA